MNIGPLEVIVIFVVALLVFGPAKLPEIGRQVGKAVREFRKFQSSFQHEFRDILDDAAPGPVVPPPASAPTAEQVPQAQAEDGSAPPSPEPAVPLRPVTGDEAPQAGEAGDGASGPPAATA